MPTGKAMPRTTTPPARQPACDDIRWRVVAEIAAHAATPAERLLACFRPVQNRLSDAAAERRAEQWLDAIASDDRCAAESLFGRRGLGRATRIEGCREVALVDPAGAPDWIDDLARFLDLLEEADCETEVPPLAVADVVHPDAMRVWAIPPDRPWRFQHAFGPFLRGAVRWQAQTLSVLPLEIAAEARRGMVAQLAWNWNYVACQTLNHVPAERGGRERPSGGGMTVHDRMFGLGRQPRAAWIELFRRYPVLARLLARAYRRWQVTVVEAMSRLAQDRDRLESAFCRGRPLGALVAYAGNAGDIHDGGRSVAILTFESGTRVVYKPRPQDLAIAYLRLVRGLNATGVNPRLHERRIVRGDGYGWDEFVMPRPCVTDTERRVLHRGVGTLARLLQLLDATDITADNVLVHGDQPVPIDVETLLCPRRPLDVRLSAGDRAAAERSWDSPFTSGVITARQGAPPGRRGPDVGALASGVFGSRCAADGRGPGGESIAPGSGRHRPTQTEAPAASGGCHAEVIGGYVAMAIHLSRTALRSAGAESALAAMATAPVRYVLRDTAVYQRILEASLTPERLHDGVAREISLERLFRAGLAGRAPLHVIQAEVNALRDLDIPIFFGRPDGDALDWPGGGRAPGFFAGRSIDRLYHRLEMLKRSVDPDAERNLIRSALFSIGTAPPETRSPSRPRPPSRRRSAGGESWLERAVRLGDELLSYAVTPAGAGPVWIGLNYHPWTDAWRYGPLQLDLLTGSVGLGVALADLYGLSDEPRFRDAARHILRPAMDRLADNSRAAEPARLHYGAFVGWGAWYYAVHRAGHALGDGNMIETAWRSRRRCPVGLDHAAACDDAVGGVAGLLLVLADQERGEPDDWIPFLTKRLLREQKAAGEPNGRSSWYPSGSPVLAALPLAHSAVDLALSRVSACAIHASPRSEGTGLPVSDPIPLRRRHVRLRASEAPGHVLAELGIAAERPDLRPAALAAADRFLGIDSSAMLAADPLGPGEVAITAYQVARRPAYKARAEEWMAELVDRKQRTHRWFPDSLAADQHFLSAVVGTTAVLHLLLKLHSPDTVGSLRLVETRRTA